MASNLKRLLVALALLAMTAVLYATASYPVSVKSFSTKLAGQTVASAHINDIQDEIVAMEGALLNGFAHALKPSTSGGQDLGTSGLPWRTLYVNSIAGAGGDSACGRLTLTSGVPRTTSDVTAATTLYYTPDGCDSIALYDGSAWVSTTFTELSIAVPATTSQMYDVYVYSNSGTATLELTAWTSDTARATAIARQNGRKVKTGVLTRRYVGVMRTTAVSGQTEDSNAKRYVSNEYHRIRRALQVNEATASWTYTTATFRCANTSGACADQVDVAVGSDDTLIDITVIAHSNNNGGGVARVTGIGEDSTTAPVAGSHVSQIADAAAVAMTFAHAHLGKYPAVGRHFYAWLEYSVASNTTTWYGNNGNAQLVQSGIFGWIEG